MPVYRLIYDTGLYGNPWRFATGATYPGCAQIAGTDDYTPQCDGRSYETEDLAAQDAAIRNEIPVRVSTLQEISDIVAGVRQIDPTNIISVQPPSGGGLFSNISTPMLVGGALLLLFMMSRK